VHNSFAGPVPVAAARAAAEDGFPEIDGSSAPMRRLKRDMRNVARDRDVSVLILGESGTGKERVARSIHQASSRSGAPFVVVNCAGLSPSLAEDELFGHVRGAFTGAHDPRPGPFERAAGGAVFLDEIGELAADLQKKLLRAIQQRTVQRLGDVRETPFDVRIMAATHVDLAAAVAAGRFRPDLYYRLAVYELNVPPLRGRSASDVEGLVWVLLESAARRRRRRPPDVAEEALERLLRHRWPGNVRELENTMERMLVAADGGAVLRVEHLPERFAHERSGVRPGTLPTPAELIDALRRFGGRPGDVAAALGLSRHQVYRLMVRHDLRRSTRKS
jgi:DNA-binding NtrC family response regulator